MILIEAPFPEVAAIIALPNPQFGDSKALRGTVEVKRMMDGSRWTYVKGRAGRKRVRYDIPISREKALELLEVVRVIPYDQMRITTHEGEKYVGYLDVNPLELEAVARSKHSPGDERYRVTILFDGAEV